MKQLALSFKERLSFVSLLAAQKGGGRARLGPFYRVLARVRVNDVEKTMIRYAEFTVPSAQGPMLQATWDQTEAAKLDIKPILINPGDADACAQLLRSDQLEVSAGDLEWVEVVLQQLEAKEVAVEVVPENAAGGRKPNSTKQAA